MKLNDFYTREKENEFEKDLAYEEWLNENVKEPLENELNKMQVLINRTIFKYKTNLKKPINKINYQPLQGA